VRKGQWRFQALDEKIIALYARGMSVRDIHAHLAELYGVQVGHDLIVGAGERLTPLRRLRFDPLGRLAEASGCW
jgi:transposase-like protein